MDSIRTSILLVLLVAAGACNRRTREAVSVVDAAPAPPPVPPSFAREIEPVLNRMCASAVGCHGAKPTDDVDLDLRPTAAYAQLVGHPAKERPGTMRIAPRDPAASFLVDKLRGQLHTQEGRPMPVNPDTGMPVVPSPIGDGYIDYILKPWIAAGAPNN